MMLPQRVSLFGIEDVEAFCRDALNRNIAQGSRLAGGTYTGPAPLSAADYDDCLTDLIGAAWEAAQRFRTEDDGRGTNRFEGYLVWILHKRIIDWKRKRWKSTRHLKTTVVEVSYEDEMDGIHHDQEPLGFDPGMLSSRARYAYLSVCAPMVLLGMEPKEYAAHTRRSLFWVLLALKTVRDELEQQGIRPSVMPKDQACHAEPSHSSSSNGAEHLRATA